jgi:hypothetical protein
MGALAVVVACAPRDGSTVIPSGETATRVEVHGHGIRVPVETTGGSGDLVLHEVGLPVQALWRAMPTTFETLGLRGAGALDADRRIFGYPDAVLPRLIGDRRLSYFLDCGHSPGGTIADVYRVTGSILTAVRPADDPARTVLEVTVQAIARPREVSGNTIRCASNGRLERLVATTAVRHALDNL